MAREGEVPAEPRGCLYGGSAYCRSNVLSVQAQSPERVMNEYSEHSLAYAAGYHGAAQQELRPPGPSYISPTMVWSCFA